MVYDHSHLFLSYKLSIALTSHKHCRSNEEEDCEQDTYDNQISKWSGEWSCQHDLVILRRTRVVDISAQVNRVAQGRDTREDFQVEGQFLDWGEDTCQEELRKDQERQYLVGRALATEA